jgi:DNA-binding transcriptional MocR family regulator
MNKPASSPKTFLYEQVALDLANLIRQGTFRPGERIPSVRQLSRQRKISVTTALQAYIQLEDQGLIEARPQSGYYVRSQFPGALPEPEISAPSRDPAQVSVRELVMMVLKDSHNPDLIQLGAAIPNAELVTSDKLNRILAGLARQAHDQLNQYDLPPGYEPLRVQLAQRAVLSGCQLAPADIVTTSGCMEAFVLSLRATCRPGDTVAIESPMYFGVLQVLEALDLRALEIPTHPRDGLSLEALKFAIQHTPSACLVLSNFNNPLGSCIPTTTNANWSSCSPSTISRWWSAISLARSISPASAPAWLRPTTAGLVLLCSSFSKTCVPVTASAGWCRAATRRPSNAKYTTSVATATLPQVAVAQFLAGGGYDYHLRRVRRVYAQYVAQLGQAVMQYFPDGTRITRPNGGHVLWVQMPEYADSLELYKHALQAGITITPGYLFSASHQYRNFIRLNAALWSPAAHQAVKKLGELIAGQKELLR